jgi:hypothetical protein
MTAKKSNINLLIYLTLCLGGIFIMPFIASCGKQPASQAGLNIRYQIMNLSPDLLPVDLFIDFRQENANLNPFIYGVSHGYFYVSSIDTPYQIRSDRFTGNTLFTRVDPLKTGASYTLYLTGDVATNTLKPIFTVDTSSIPKVGYGKIRFVNASPSGSAGFDVYANGSIAFKSFAYPKVSDYLELPNGNYDFQIRPPGSTTVLKELTETISDGRLYTLYSYGYTTRTDTASFNAGFNTDK